MRNLNFKVSGQKLSKEGDFDNIVVGSKGYLKACFTFNSEWKGFAKVAVFKSNSSDEVPAKINANGECLIPDSVTDGAYINVRVVGKSKTGQIITTGNVSFLQSSK